MADTIGFRALVSVDDGGTGGTGADTVFQGIAEVMIPGEETGEVETTDHNQSDYVKRYAPTLIDPGTLKFTLKANSANMDRLRALQTGRVIHTWKVKAPPGEAFGATTPQAFSVTGFLKKRDEVKFDREGLAVVPVEVRVSGPWAVTARTDPA